MNHFSLTRGPPEEQEENKSPTCENRPQKYRILLEPALVGAMIAINLGQTSLQNFYLQTACTVDLGVDLEVCEKGDMEVINLFHTLTVLLHHIILIWFSTFEFLYNTTPMTRYLLFKFYAKSRIYAEKKQNPLIFQ